MLLLQVNNRETVELFHEVPVRIYNKDPDWIPHAYKEIEHVFDRTQNGAFQHGDAMRWVLLNRDFEPVGRIAAFFNEKNGSKALGGVGFYECDHNDAHAKCLFTHAEKWLQVQGLEGADGPVNFGERHQFWGCKVGETAVPIYQENFNPAYYQHQFLSNHYFPYFESITYEIDVEKFPVTWLDGLYRKVQRREFTFDCFNADQPEQFINDYLAIAEKAFDLTNRIVKIDKATILNLLNVHKGVMRTDLTWFAYKHGRPVGVLGFMLNWSGILNNALKFNEARPKKSIKGFLVAIAPEFQKSGALVGLIYHATQAILSDGNIGKLYICGIAGHSNHVQSVTEKFGGRKMTRHLTFRKFFDGRNVKALSSIDIN